jgi:osmotically-inducible protein OsmY
MRKRTAKEAAAEQSLVDDSYPPQYASEAIKPHRLEQEVQRELLAEPHFRFASLVVRRIHDGVCLQGVLETNDNSPDVCSVAQRVSGVQQVLNRLLITPRREIPPKG